MSHRDYHAALYRNLTKVPLERTRTSDHHPERHEGILMNNDTFKNKDAYIHMNESDF